MTRFDKEVILSYPDRIKQLPFCNWKYEEVNGQTTKVPYNPLSGYRASSSNLNTMTTLENVLAAVKDYNGISVKVSNGIGFIDIDDCVRDDGTLSELAQAIIALLADAIVEYSPSGKGLHLIFLMPEGFVFDKDEYFVNNKTIHVENYYPEYSNQLMTMTGNVLRMGTMEVTAEQLTDFINTYMKRPEQQKPDPAELPEGGSVLTDEEVIARAANSPTGQKFMDYYNGDWEKYGGDNPNWSQSEADLGFCSMLAFWCRGDMEQMDRIFCESGLYREKWDRHQSGSTYGEITMRKAIAGCTAFYEPGYRADTAEDDFDDVANITAAIDDALDSDLDIDTVFSPEFLSNALWAYRNDPARYTKLRSHLPKEVSVRDFTREVKKLDAGAGSESSVAANEKASLLRLKGVSTANMLIPGNWIANDSGIRHWEMVMGVMTPVRVTSEPLFVSSKLVNVDDGTEKLEVTFRRNGQYKKLIAPRADMLNRNSIVKYADEGFPVSSGNSATLTQYIEETEAINTSVIPISRSIRRAGWIGDEFFPYSLKDGIAAQSDGNETERILAALTTNGSEEAWIAVAAKARRMPFARAMLAASFASPLLERLQHRVIYVHIWYSTRSGKTAVLKLAISIWGDPMVLVSKYFSTIVGMERWAGTLKHLPFAMDELQTLNQKRLSVNDVVYTLGNGSGKTRGRVGAGLQKVETWRNCILSTGEQPMSSDNSMDGVNTRLMELYACPLNETGKGDPDDALASELHKISEQNYGFAGERYIRYLVEKVLPVKGKMQDDLVRFKEVLELLCSDSVQLDNTAVLCLADYYASMSVFGETEDVAFEGAISLGKSVLGNIEDNRHQDSISMAWDTVCGWVASNKLRFVGSSALHEVSPLYGMVENKKVFAINTEMNKALEDAGYSVRKCIKGFQERGYIESFTDSEGKKRSQTLKRIKGINTRVYALNLEIADDDNQPPFMNTEPLLSRSDDFLK